MKFLISGGAGFVGSHLSERLLADGHEVAVIDNLTTGRFQNVSKLAANARFRFFVEDLSNAPFVDGIVQGVDAIFHLASTVGVKLVVNSPVKTIRNIIIPSSNILEAANRYRKRILLTSTSEVYGLNTKVPFNEESERIEGPTTVSRWSYAATKSVMEFLALAYRSETELPVTIVRLFNTVGPRQTDRYGMVVPSFVRAALNNLPITIYGDGKQSRCFCHVTDVVDALVRIINSENTLGEVINVGTQQEISILQLAEKVKAATGSTSQVRFETYESGYGRNFEDMQRRVPDIEKVKRLVGWTPQRNLDTIIKDVIDTMKPQMGGAAEPKKVA